MANEINTRHSSVLLNNTPKPAGKSGVNGGGSQAAVNKDLQNQEDKVSVTSEASRLQKIEEQLSTVPAVNSARVAEIRAQIADGSFKIDPATIADKLISFETGKG